MFTALPGDRGARRARRGCSPSHTTTVRGRRPPRGGRVSSPSPPPPTPGASSTTGRDAGRRPPPRPPSAAATVRSHPRATCPTVARAGASPSGVAYVDRAAGSRGLQPPRHPPAARRSVARPRLRARRRCATNKPTVSDVLDRPHDEHAGRRLRLPRRRPRRPGRAGVLVGGVAPRLLDAGRRAAAATRRAPARRSSTATGHVIVGRAAGAGPGHAADSLRRRRAMRAGATASLDDVDVARRPAAGRLRRASRTRLARGRRPPVRRRHRARSTPRCTPRSSRSRCSPLVGVAAHPQRRRRLDRLDAERDAALDEQRTIALRLQRSLLPDRPGRPGRRRPRQLRARPGRDVRRRRLVRRRRPRATGASRCPSATSPATAWPPPPRWGSCAAPRARSRSAATSPRDALDRARPLRADARRPAAGHRRLRRPRPGHRPPALRLRRPPAAAARARRRDAREYLRGRAARRCSASSRSSRARSGEVTLAPGRHARSATRTAWSSGRTARSTTASTDLAQQAARRGARPARRWPSALLAGVRGAAPRRRRGAVRAPAARRSRGRAQPSSVAS